MMCSTDTLFKLFRDCLDAEVKRLTGLGVGSNINEGQTWSEDEENKLWIHHREFCWTRWFSDWQEFFTSKWKREP